MTVSEKECVVPASAITFGVDVGAILNQTLKNLSWDFHETAEKQCLELNQSNVMMFDRHASDGQPNGSDVWLRRKHAEGNIHEPATVAAFVAVEKMFSARVGCVMDIGALYGYFSVMASSLFPSSEVIGFEVNPTSYSALRKNAQMNGAVFQRNIRCANIGLSDQSRLSTSIHIDGFRIQESSESEGADSGSTLGMNVLDVFSLDDYSRITDVKPDLIKIDVEGYQVKIIPGAMSVIEENTPAIILEFDNINRMKELGSSNLEISKVFFDLGYRCWWISDQRHGTGQFREIGPADFDGQVERNSLAVFVHNSWIS